MRGKVSTVSSHDCTQAPTRKLFVARHGFRFKRGAAFTGTLKAIRQAMVVDATQRKCQRGGPNDFDAFVDILSRLDEALQDADANRVASALWLKQKVMQCG